MSAQPAVDAFERTTGLRGRVETPKPDPATSIAPLTTRELYLIPGAVFVMSRFLLALLGFAGPHVLGLLHKNESLLPQADPLAAAWQWSNPWFRFDAGWYVGLAEHGYHSGALGHANTNFFPLYPALIRLVQPLTLNSPWIAALLIANLSFLAALLLLWRWALLRWDREGALRVLMLTVVFPFSFFFAAPYAESLFLALAVATLLFAEQDRWILATCAAGLSTVTRPVGVAVVLALVVMALQRRDSKRVCLAIGALLPLLAFIAYLTIIFRQPFAFLTYHSAGWVRPHGGLLTTVTSQFHTHLSPLDRVDAALAVLFLASALVAWRSLGPSYCVLVLVGVLLPLAHGLVSMERYVIVLFPAIALWASWKSKIGQTAVFSVSLTLLVTATMMFTAGFSLF